MSSEKTIEDWRARIDAIDKQVLDLLSERARCVVGVGQIKVEHGMTIFDPAREQQIITNVLHNNKGPLKDDALRRIFQSLIEECRRLESETHGR